jgi:hypothetical protein
MALTRSWISQLPSTDSGTAVVGRRFCGQFGPSGTIGVPSGLAA